MSTTQVSFVLDASATMAWCFEDEARPESDRLLRSLGDEPALVPALWQWEVVNVLLVAQRKGRMTEAQADRFLALLAQLPIEIETTASLAGVLSTGRRHGLSAYDAAYLELAARAGLGLATLDARLAEAARSAGIPLILSPA